MAARADVSVTFPFGVRKTIWSASPPCAGKRLCSRSVARCESVLGSANVFAVRVPTALERAMAPTARTIQETTTIRRWAIVQRVSFSIGELQSGSFASLIANLHAMQGLYHNPAWDAKLRAM